MTAYVFVVFVLQIKYTNWHPGMPNGRTRGENCVVMFNYYDGNWNDVSCRSPFHGAVCQADIGQLLKDHR